VGLEPTIASQASVLKTVVSTSFTTPAIEQGQGAERLPRSWWSPNPYL
jgi:hypothetical protein